MEMISDDLAVARSVTPPDVVLFVCRTFLTRRSGA
jgi:hypothetical protein